MNKGIILVDYDNAFYGSGNELQPGFLQGRLEDFILSCLSAVPDIDFLLIRLYGGWKMNANYTSRASKVLGSIEEIKSKMFPFFYEGRRIIGNLELAVSQFNLGIEWDNTLQEKSAKHFLSVRTDASHVCSHKPEECPIHLIAKATRGQQVVCPIDQCETIDVSQLVRMEQKMVDSMMTCDILEFSNDDDSSVVEVISDDIDLHPAMALAGEKYAIKKGVTLVLMVKNRKNSEQFERLLGTHHIKIRLWQ